MPELPEVSYFKKYADSTSLHKEIAKLEFPESKILQAPKKDIENALIGTEFTGSTRIGKYLIMEAGKSHALVFHFGMTGKLEYSHDEEPPDYSRFIIRFKDNSALFFVCPRKFGKIFLTKNAEEFQKEQSLGPDAMDLDKKEFLEILDGKKGSIKAALTNQNLIAGIGNLYSDEILYQSKVHPKTNISKLTNKEKEELFKNMRKVLEKVTKSRMDGSSVPDSYLTRHRDEGGDCPGCGGKVKVIKVSGRSTYFCPECQKEK